MQTLVVAAAALAGVLACPPSVRAAAPAIGVGAVAPDFVLKATDGRNLRLSEYRGDVVIVTFSAAWCGACRSALQGLKGIAAQSDDEGPVVLGVDLDGDAAPARALARSLDLDYPMLVDTRQQVGRLYDVDSLPFTVLLDRDGVVRGAWTDTAPPAADLKRLIAEVRP
jgi:peroxiredoxin